MITLIIIFTLIFIILGAILFQFSKFIKRIKKWKKNQGDD